MNAVVAGVEAIVCGLVEHEAEYNETSRDADSLSGHLNDGVACVADDVAEADGEVVAEHTSAAPVLGSRFIGHDG